MVTAIVKEIFEASLATFQQDSIAGMAAMKDKLVAANHNQCKAIQQRYGDVMKRWAWSIMRRVWFRKASLRDLICTSIVYPWGNVYNMKE